ncbi:MAG: transcriptional regulator, partial [Syntrophomonadaceae bacterium]|nr:transcriptional regulator [Syntrophomonadaceae bacterium]
VGDAFRYYFNAAGEIVYNVAGIGLELSDLDNISLVVAVAGGSNKAWAIESVLTNRRRGTLISDEGAARAILERRR